MWLVILLLLVSFLHIIRGCRVTSHEYCKIFDFYEHIATIPITADASDVGATMKLSCMYAYASKLPQDHRFWANVRLMKKNGTSGATLDEQRQINSDREPYMHFTVLANGIKDPKDIYIDIKHNCVRNHTTMYRVKNVDVEMDSNHPTVKDVGTIFLP